MQGTYLLYALYYWWWHMYCAGMYWMYIGGVPYARAYIHRIPKDDSRNFRARDHGPLLCDVVYVYSIRWYTRV